MLDAGLDAPAREQCERKDCKKPSPADCGQPEGSCDDDCGDEKHPSHDPCPRRIRVEIDLEPKCKKPPAREDCGDD